METVVPFDSEQACSTPQKSSSPNSEPPPYSTREGPVLQPASNPPAYPAPGGGQVGFPAAHPAYPAQPQLVVLARPQRTVKPGTERRRRRAAVICGIIELLHGAALLIIGFVFIGRVDAGLASPAFFTPLFVFATAILSLFAGLRNYRSCFIATLVMAIITSLVTGACFILYTIECATHREYHHSGSRYYSNRGGSLAIMFGLAFVINLFLTVICIVQSSYACAVVCSCCRPDDPMSGAMFAYMAHPDQNGQLVFGGQGLPVIDLGRQNIPQPVVNIPQPVVMNEGVRA